MALTEKWAGAIVLLLGLGLWPGCGVDGERGMTGECPWGEVCDPSTPEGLNFVGESPTDLFFASTLATATGGTQTFRIRGASGADVPPFDAASSDMSTLLVTSVVGTNVEVLGRSAGSAYLRILSGSTGELLDRTGLTVADVDRVELRAVTGVLSPLSNREWVYLAGSRVVIATALFSASGDRLIDASAEIEAVPGVEPVNSDAAIVDVPSELDTLELVTRLGSGERVGRATIVSEVQTLTRVGDTSQSLVRIPALQVDEPMDLCFEALYGETQIAGVTLATEAAGPVEVIPPEPESSGWPAFGVCVRVVGTEPGEAMLTITVPGLVKSQRLRVVM